MLKTLFSTALVLAAALTTTADAYLYSDDPNTFCLYHAESYGLDNTTTVDDATAATGRTSNPLLLNAWNLATLTAEGGGYDPAGTGKAIDFINPTSGLYEGNRGCKASNTWPNYRDQVKVQGWFYIPSVSCLPMSTTYGGSGAAECYVFQVSSGNDSGRIFSMYMNTTGGNGGGSPAAQSVRLRWAPAGTPSTANSLWMQFYNPGLGINYTGKWVRVTATAMRDTSSSDPNFSRITLSIYDPSAGTTDSNSRTMDWSLGQAAGRIFFLGWMSNKTSSPYRGLRGKVDEFQVRDRVEGTHHAWNPTPANGVSITPTSDLTLQWTKALPRYMDKPINQNVYFGTTNPPTARLNATPWSVTGNSISAGAVVLTDPPTTYYWQVDSNDPGARRVTPSKVFSFTVDDIAPVVDCGEDRVTYLANGTRTLSFTPTVIDVDTPENQLTYQWTQLAGPAAATIASPNSKNTNITMTVVGSYYFQLAVYDGAKFGTDVVRVRVFSTACLASQAIGGFAFKSADFNEDCWQNFIDYAQMMGNWLRCNSLDPACN